MSAFPPRERRGARFLLLCASEDCEAFRRQLNENHVANVAETFEHAAALLGRLGAMETGGAAVVVIDAAAPEAWETLVAIKEGPLRHVPVVALSDGDDAKAYERHANAVLPRARWAEQLAGDARTFGAFWITLVRLPAVNG